jgi:hypothetical protein
MPRYEIEYNNTTTIRREFPEELGDIKSATVAVYDRGGTALLAATAATVPNIGAATSYTFKAILTSATKIGENTCTLDATPDTIYAGDVYRIGGTSSTEDTLTVEAYNSSTRVVTFSDYFRHAHAAGEYVKPRFCTYSLVTTTVATWTANLECTFVWTFYSGGDGATGPYMPYTDIGTVYKRIAGEGGMESAFRLRFRQFAEMVEGPEFIPLSKDADDELADLFASKGMDTTKVVDSHAFYELRLAQMAYDLAVGGGTDWDSERAAITARRLELINLVSSLPVWVDSDQDLSEEDEEVQTYERPMPRRRIF